MDLTIKTVVKQWQAALSKSSANKEFCNELEKLFKTAKEQWYITITFFCKLNLFFFVGKGFYFENIINQYYAHINILLTIRFRIMLT